MISQINDLKKITIKKNNTNKEGSEIDVVKLNRIDIYPNDGYTTLVLVNGVKIIIDLGIFFTVKKDGIIYITKKQK